MMLHAALEAEAVVAHSCSHDVLHALSMIRQQHILRRFLLRLLMKDQLPQEGVVEAAAAAEEGRRSSWLPFALSLASGDWKNGRDILSGLIGIRFYRDSYRTKRTARAKSRVCSPRGNGIEPRTNR